MALKRFGDFIKETPKPTEVKKEETNRTEIIENKGEIKKESNDKPIINGNCIYFPSYIKPSKAVSILSENNFSKDKLHYIMINDNDSIILVKYNENKEIKLDSLVEGLMAFYIKNGLDVMSECNHTGNDIYSVINNIPKVTINKVPVGEIIKKDISKLLNK